MKGQMHITRKDIARAIGMSVKTVERKAKEWGLEDEDCVSSASGHTRLYFRDVASRKLIRRRVIKDPIC